MSKPPYRGVAHAYPTLPARTLEGAIAHPFASLLVPFRFLEEINRLPATDPWFARRLYRPATPDGNPRQLTSEAPGTSYGLAQLSDFGELGARGPP
jgi:hypothetical protein